jgi:hypothetical protein
MIGFVNGEGEEMRDKPGLVTKPNLPIALRIKVTIV